MSESRLEASLALALSGGLVVSAMALLLGLLLSQPLLLRWGIMALIATPCIGSVILAGGLLAKRDWLFAAVCLWILAVLCSSLFIAMRS